MKSKVALSSKGAEGHGRTATVGNVSSKSKVNVSSKGKASMAPARAVAPNSSGGVSKRFGSKGK